MKYLILFALLGCGKLEDCPGMTTYYSKNGQSLAIGCGRLVYVRPTPKCRLSAHYQNISGYNIEWNLTEGSCFFKEPLTTSCYLNLETVDNQVELSCQEIGIHMLFERIR